MKSQRMSKVIIIHPEGNKNVCSEFQFISSSDSCFSLDWGGEQMERLTLCPSPQLTLLTQSFCPQTFMSQKSYRQHQICVWFVGFLGFLFKSGVLILNSVSLRLDGVWKRSLIFNQTSAHAALSSGWEESLPERLNSGSKNLMNVFCQIRLINQSLRSVIAQAVVQSEKTTQCYCLHTNETTV